MKKGIFPKDFSKIRKNAVLHYSKKVSKFCIFFDSDYT